MNSKYNFLLVQPAAPIAIVTMNRPERRNALSLELMEELIDCIGALGKENEVRAIILA
ncbi:MAG: enoyl-CoA hydratase/isomerase family protein, partial [Blastocatellia bacterium]